MTESELNHWFYRYCATGHVALPSTARAIWMGMTTAEKREYREKRK